MCMLLFNLFKFQQPCNCF
uniref:Uncharacterized protein n=1 Tax=Anguilla anguilla TaxID=7936 RepID=A0A0E9Q8A8_ANGAN